MMRSARIATVALIGLFEIACIVTTLVTCDRPVAQYGFNVGTDGITVAAVERDFPAARAGIVPGDRFVYASLAPRTRRTIIDNESVVPGTVLSARIVHNRSERSILIAAQALPALYSASDLSFAFGGLALGIVSLALVLLRPSPMTWAFALVAPPLVLPEALFLWAQGASTPETAAFDVFVAFLYAMQTAGMMIFASRFPSDRPRGLTRLIDKAAVPVGVVSALVYVYVDAAIAWSPAPPQGWVLFTQDVIAPAFPSAAALIGLLATYTTSANADRNRLLPTIAAFILLIVTATGQQFGLEITSSPSALLALNFAFSLSAALVAAAVAYGVVRHRVIDVNFIVGHTLVYSVITIFAVSLFTLIEYLFGKLLERGGLATLLEIVAALCIGLSLNFLHARVDRFIDVVLFRRRHLAQERLDRAAGTLPHATSKHLVEELLVGEPVDALNLASAAVFTRDEGGGRYVRALAHGWGTNDAQELDADDHVVIRLRAELHAADLARVRWPRTDLPTGPQQPIYAVPITVGNSVVAIVLYGGHNGGEDLDPDERRNLQALAGGAALAYDHLTAEALQQRLEEARRENDALRRVERTLSDLLKERLGNPPGLA